MVDIEKLALLARIKLAPKEKNRFQKEFEAILGYVSKLKDINEEEFPPETDQPLAERIKNIMREDKDYHQLGEFSKDLLKRGLPAGRQAPMIERDYVKVKHILE